MESNKKESIYTTAETVFVTFITYIGFVITCHTLLEITIDTTVFLIWSIMAGVVFGIQKIGNTKSINVAIFLYSIFLFGWLFIENYDKKWQYTVMFYGGFLALQVLYKILLRTVGKLVCGFGIIAILIVSRFWEIEYSKPIIAVSIFLLLYTISELLACFYYGNTKFLIIVYAFISVLTMLTPASKEPYDWGFVYRISEFAKKTMNSIVTEIQYQLSDITMADSLSFQVTGYSDGKMNLFQEMATRDIEQLLLQGDYTRGNLYLKGRICNKYTGTGWTTDESLPVIDYRTDALMTLYAIFRETEDINELNRFMEIKEQKITFKNIKTKSLFYPLKVLSVSAKDTNSIGDHIRSNKVNERSYQYSYCFVDLDYTNERLIAILNKSKEMEYEEALYDRVYVNLEKMYHIKIEKIPFEDFKKQVELIEDSEKYYNDIENLLVSERIMSLSKTLTKECYTNYEVSKELESYLYQYNYNKSAVIPPDVNVPDYFLFQGKEGYCAHFATALTAMLKSQGIRARVVEGFLVNYKERTDIYDYSVSSRLAHIWVEAYLDGFGWIRLEPTVIYKDMVQKPWFYEKSNISEDEIFEDEINEELQKNQLTSNMNQDMVVKKENNNDINSWWMLLKLLTVMILCVTIVVFAELIYQRNMLKKSNCPNVVCLRILNYLEKKYTKRQKNETIREFLLRICNDMELEKQEQDKLMKISEILDAYWYGEQDISQETILWMKEYIL